jgi:hypothetical protein
MHSKQRQVQLAWRRACLRQHVCVHRHGSWCQSPEGVVSSVVWFVFGIGWP